MNGRFPNHSPLFFYLSNRMQKQAVPAYTGCLTLDFVDSNKSQLKPMKDENE